MTAIKPVDLSLTPSLKARKPLRGLFNGLNSAPLVEMMAFAGFDFVIIDNEHGSADHETTHYMITAARAAGITPWVRCFPRNIARVLDMGASGLVIPGVESAEQAKALVDSVRFPPMGHRGVAFSVRSAGYGAFGGDQYIKDCNAGIALIPMIETPEGVKNAKAIAGVEGVDAVFIGPNDLAQSHGFGSTWLDEPTQLLMKQIMQDVLSMNKAVGTLYLNQEHVDRYSSWGGSFFANVITSVLTQAFKIQASKEKDVKVGISY